MKRVFSFLLCIVMMLSCFVFTVSARDFTVEESIASDLRDLGLFKGVSDTEFDLDRAPTRVEALIMLIRVLGKEAEALSGDWEHPFTDVPEWADKYIGYAYENKLTNGQSATEFGIGTASDAMFITFVLRSLGYSDVDGKDFVWSDPFTLASKIAITNESVHFGEEFMRADVVLISAQALETPLKDSDITLGEKLIGAGVFTKEKYLEYFEIPEKEEVVKELSAEEIYAKCSPAVFYIEICDASGKAIGSGSGFFIDDKGTAVTNYHVIKSAYSAKAQLTSSEEKYEIQGYYDYSEKEDWAIVKVNCENTAYLKVGSPDTVVGAATVYAIGSPLGLQNTITQGIISNTARKDEETGVTYIQTSAALSSGSSGGALINKFGQVIGITSSGYKKGQNLNLAIPVTVIEGYSREELHDFNPLGFTNDAAQTTTDPFERQQLAFTVLKEFILDNGQNKNAEGWTEYRSTQYGQGVQIDCYVYYNGSDDCITTKVIYDYENMEGNPVKFGLTIHLRSDSFETSVEYFYDVSHSPTTASGIILNSMYDGPDDTEDYKFDYFSGHSYQQSQHEQIACSIHASTLAFLNRVFSSAMSEHGMFSVADLGYTSFEA